MDVEDALGELFERPTFSGVVTQPPAPAKVPTQAQPRDRPGAHSSKRPAQQQHAQAKTKRARKGKVQKGAHSNEYAKKPISNARSMYQRKRYYLIICGNMGAAQLCEVVFNSLGFRDFRMANNVTVHQLTYVTCLAMYARLASLAVDMGYIEADVPDISRLIRSVRGLQLPAVLAKYIEAIGVFKMATGVEVSAWFSTREAMQNRHFRQVNLDDLLIADGRVVPDNYWSVDREWIADWNQATTRPARLGMHFRPLNWSETTGTPEMLITPLSHEEDGGQYLRPTAPQQFTDVEATLGAIYRYRSYQALQHWPAQTALVCTRLMYGTELYWLEAWSDVIVASFTSDAARSN